jgi:hypothetical protein
MANLSTYYPAPITAADLGLGAGSNATFGSIQNTPIGSTTPAAGTFTTLTANNGTLTASAPVLDLSQTWNNAAVTFTGLKIAITNTAAGISSNIIQVDAGASGTTSTFFVRRDGAVTTLNSINVAGGGTMGGPALTMATTQFRGGSNCSFAWTGSANNAYGSGADLILLRDAANTLAQYNGTNPQAYNIYNTFTSSTNHERGFLKWNANVFQIGTEVGSGGGTQRQLQFSLGTVTADTPLLVTQTWNNAAVAFSALRINVTNTASQTVSFLQEWQTGGVTQAYMRTDGVLYLLGGRIISTGVGTGEGARFPYNSSAFINSPSLTLGNGGTGAGANGVVLATEGSSDILAIRRTTNAQAFRIYNTVSGTGNVNFDRVNFRWASNEFIIDAEAGGTGTLRGIKIGSATSSLLGFYGAAPVAQQAAVADSTDTTNVATQLNALLARLRTLGLIAT